MDLRPTVLALLLLAIPARAQTPPGPYAYIVGTEIGRDLASATRNVVGDGHPDAWLRAHTRNLAYYLGKTEGGGYGPYHIKNFILRTKGSSPYRQWDTIPYSQYPLLQVVYRGQLINNALGSIAGWTPPNHEVVDFYIADDGGVSLRHTPMEWVIEALEGTYTVPVRLDDLWDAKTQ